MDIWHWFRFRGRKWISLSACTREKQIRDCVCLLWTWGRDWRVPYTYQPNPRRVRRTRQLRQIFTSCKVQSLRFTCYGTRARFHASPREHVYNNGITVLLMCIRSSWYFFYIRQGTMAQLLRGEVCLILRTGFYHTFVTRVFQYFMERLNISLLCAWWYKYTLLLIILFAMLQNIAN